MNISKRWLSSFCGVAAVSLAVGTAHASTADVMENLRQLSIEELADIEVTSVSKRAEPLSAAPAAIYVITNEDIRRFGAQSLPEALRLAPNLQVAKLDALSYAISARGFNSTEAGNKLLVMIDGRSIYSPLHSGVFWDAQDVMLEDIDRIEVVSGPGGTLWGANAVNGVINVVTKSARDTQGALISGNSGSADWNLGARYGGKVGEAVDYRVYVKGFQRSRSRNPNGTYHIDGWDRYEGGFNVDWKSETDQIKLSGDAYDSSLDFVRAPVTGQNVALNWSHDFGGSQPLQVQAYIDRTHRNQPGVIFETVKTYNVDVQYGFAVGQRNVVVLGGGYRVIQDYFDTPPPLDVVNARATLKLFNLFVQDELALTDTVKLTAGVKFENHSYVGSEYMPNVRLAWQPSDTMLWWASVSRAVRTPARLDRELVFLPFLLPAPDFDSETVIAYEAGYRGRLGDNFTLSVSGFYNVYDDLRTTSLLSAAPLQLKLQNGMEGDTYGTEIWGQYSIADWWRLSGGVTLLKKKLHLKPGVVDSSNMQAAGNDPSSQFTIRSLMNPFPAVEVDVGLRYVDKLTTPAVPSYTALDARLGFHLAEGLTFNVSAFNLLDDFHQEGGPAASRREVARSVTAGFTFAF